MDSFRRCAFRRRRFSRRPPTKEYTGVFQKFLSMTRTQLVGSVHQFGQNRYTEKLEVDTKSEPTEARKKICLHQAPYCNKVSSLIHNLKFTLDSTDGLVSTHRFPWALGDSSDCFTADFPVDFKSFHCFASSGTKASRRCRVIKLVSKQFSLHFRSYKSHRHAKNVLLALHNPFHHPGLSQNPISL